MPALRKKPSEKRSEHVGIRMTPARKKQLEKCARVRGISVGELVDEAVGEYLGSLGSKRGATWKLIDTACSILEERGEEQRWRKRNR